MYLGDIAAELVVVLTGPLQVQPVGPELAGGRGHERARALGRRHLVQGLVGAGQPVRVPAVLGVAEVEDKNIAVAVEAGHRYSFGRYLRSCRGLTAIMPPRRRRRGGWWRG